MIQLIKIHLFMKTNLLTISFIFFGLVAFSQPEVKHSKIIDSILKAHRLVQEGYKSKNPSKLMEAAEIIKSNKVNILRTEDNTSGTDVFDISQLVIDAEDISIQRNIKLPEIEEYKSSVLFGSGRRSITSPPYVKNDKVSSNSFSSYNVYFRKGKIAEVYVEGDGSTELQLQILDKNNKDVVRKSISKTPYVSWAAGYSGNYKIVLTNMAKVYNNFLIIIN